MTDTKVAPVCALKILETFEDYQTRFRQITQRADSRFRKRQWARMQADALERLDLYAATVDKLESAIRHLLGGRFEERQLWEAIKQAYSEHLSAAAAPEIARTFFNSVTRRIFTTVGVDTWIEFTATEFNPSLSLQDDRVFKSYPVQNGLAKVVTKIVTDYGFDPEIFKEKDIPARITAPISVYLDRAGIALAKLRFEMHRRIFYRGQGAYLIGRLVSGEQVAPIVLALLNPEPGIEVDAVLLGVTSVRILFSFTRSAFHVLAKSPGATVNFLASLLESKPEAEIYSAIGYYKHGKTLLYRDLLRHTKECTLDRFEISIGKRGMVMIVFDMANNNMVLKLIRDRFQNPKTTTWRKVIQQYDFVFKHYRVGRLIEAQPFEYLVFDICWFSDELLQELLREASRTVRVESDRVIISHAYVERRVTPLDIFLDRATPEASAEAVIDFGNAIKDLAFSNVFPGDMLLKNFGVTRHRRVVFYDYDEIVPLTDCNFKAVPRPRTHMEEMASKPWYFVAENDVFPEELDRFLGLSPRLKEIFLEHHRDLFGTNFWQSAQADIRAGKMKHIAPYASKYRIGR